MALLTGGGTARSSSAALETVPASELAMLTTCAASARLRRKELSRALFLRFRLFLMAAPSSRAKRTHGMIPEPAPGAGVLLGGSSLPGAGPLEGNHASVSWNGRESSHASRRRRGLPGARGGPWPRVSAVIFAGRMASRAARIGPVMVAVVPLARGSSNGRAEVTTDRVEQSTKGHGAHSRIRLRSR
jgi:hypothetical protein